MDCILIKPHHFIDVIKLYGSGIEWFIPDVKMGHDFYKIANMIIVNPHIRLKLTIGGDDICRPCRYYKKRCADKINHILNITSKNEYNEMLDKRIIKLYHLIDKEYTALEICEILYNNHELILKIWLEEENQITQKRHHMFIEGAKKFLNII